MKSIYKEDAFQVFEEYERRYSLKYDVVDLVQIDYVKHYCKKFGIPFIFKNKTILGNFYKEWNISRGNENCL